MVDERVTEELIYEYWDCSYCGQKAIRGDLETCTGCGHPRDRGIEFYRLEDREEAVADEAQQERFLAGPDWVCSFCQALNSATEEVCRGCGGTRAASEENYFQTQKDKAVEEPKRPAAPPPKGGRPVKGIIAAVIAIVVLGVWWANRTTDVTYRVDGVDWERTIEVLRYDWQQREDWRDQVRGADVQILDSRREVRRTERRQVGTRPETYQDTERYRAGTKEKCTTSYKSTGSGASRKIKTCRDVPVYKTRTITKTRQVPVYKEFPIYGDKVTYRAKDYAPYHVARAKGEDNQPRWPTPALGTGLDGKVDKTGKKTETYRVYLRRVKGPDKAPEKVTLQTTEKRFTTVWTVGSEVVLPVNNLGHLVLDKGDELVSDESG